MAWCRSKRAKWWCWDRFLASPSCSGIIVFSKGSSRIIADSLKCNSFKAPVKHIPMRNLRFSNNLFFCQETSPRTFITLINSQFQCKVESPRVLTMKKDRRRYLILMARPLAELRQRRECLRDQREVVLANLLEHAERTLRWAAHLRSGVLIFNLLLLFSSLGLERGDLRSFSQSSSAFLRLLTLIIANVSWIPPAACSIIGYFQVNQSKITRYLSQHW